MKLSMSIKKKLSDFPFELGMKTIREIRANFNDPNPHQRHNKGIATKEIVENIANGLKCVRVMFLAEVRNGENVIVDGNHFKDSCDENELFITCTYKLKSSEEVRVLMGLHNNDVAPTPSWKLYTNPSFIDSLDLFKANCKIEVAEKASKFSKIIDYRDATRIIVNSKTKDDGCKVQFLKDKPTVNDVKKAAAKANKLHYILQKAVAPDLHHLFIRGVAIAAWSSLCTKNANKAIEFISRNQLTVHRYLSGKRLHDGIVYAIWKFFFASALGNANEKGEKGKFLAEHGCFIRDEVK